MITVYNKIILSWDDINALVDILCTRIQDEFLPIDSVHGLARGGLVPAVMVSHKLNLPYSNTITPTTLVIDDICDSGVTLKDGPGVYTAVLYQKSHTSCFTPNIWAELHLGDEWLLFPWERQDSEPLQDYLK